MRFSVTYQVDSLPLHYRMKVYSLLKEAVRRADTAYYEEIFVRRKNEIKPFSFAVYLSHFTITDQQILLNNMTITISATMEFAIRAFNGLRMFTEYEIDGVLWKRTNIRILKEAEINSNRVLLKTMSPILVEDKQGKPLAPTDENFEQELNYYANLLVKQMAKRELYQPIRFTPLNMKKTVIKESNQLFRRTNGEASLYFTTYHGTFQLEGHSADLQLIYQLGLGKRTSFFGLTEYISEEV